MSHYLLILFALISLALTSCSGFRGQSPALQLPNTPSAQVGTPTFFLIEKSEAGRWTRLEGSQLTYRPGESGYGWVLPVPGSTLVVVTETFVLPGPAKTWPREAVISSDGRSVTVTRRLAPRDGQLMSVWTVAEGDPQGEYELLVSLEATVHKFKFQVGLKVLSEKDLVQLVQPIVSKRKELDGLSSACLEGGWGWDETYAVLAPSDTRRQLERLIARHRNRATVFDSCLTRLRSTVKDFVTVSEAFRRQVEASPSVNAQWAALSSLVAKLALRFQATVEGVYPKLIELEVGYADYFQQIRSRSLPQQLDQPPRLEALEREITEAFKSDASKVVDEAQLLYTITPSPKTRARFELAKVLEAFWRAATVPPSVGDLNQLRQWRNEIRVVSLRLYQLSADDEIVEAIPNGKERFLVLLRDMKRIVQLANGFEAFLEPGGEKIIKESGVDVRELVRGAMEELHTIGQRMDRNLLEIDAVLR